MSFSKLFTRHFAVSALIVFGFVVLGFFVNRSIEIYSRHQGEEIFRASGDPGIFYAKLIDRLDAKHRAVALDEVATMSRGFLPFRFTLLDDGGHVLFPASEPLALEWDKLPKPAGDYEAVSTRDESKRNHLNPMGDHEGPPPVLIRLPGTPVQYLYVTAHFGPPGIPGLRDRGGPGGPGGPGGLPGRFPNGPPLFIPALGSLVVSILLGVGLSLLILFRSLQKKVRLADSVIADLQGGNLKARFPIRRMDEIGEVMSRFNAMADEIERLVTRLRDTEKGRMKLLQELAHDLRTPVASLKSLIETGSKDTVKPEVKKELTALALKEIDYFQRLVEDLLVLAQVSEPRYGANTEVLAINQLLRDEVEGVSARNESAAKKIRFKMDLPESGANISGDEHLIRRMIRNAVENAASFARNSVHVAINRRGDKQIEILIEDDGPGFSAEMLKSYGERRISRSVGTMNEGRLSVGLGSAIIKTLAQIHGGEVFVSNPTVQGQIVGARLTISLPVV